MVIKSFLIYLSAVNIKFKGAANVHWTERRGSGKNRRTVHYRSDELYYRTEYRVWGDGKNLLYI